MSTSRPFATWMIASALLPAIALAQDKPSEEGQPAPRETLQREAEALRPMASPVRALSSQWAS